MVKSLSFKLAPRVCFSAALLWVFTIACVDVRADVPVSEDAVSSAFRNAYQQVRKGAPIGASLEAVAPARQAQTDQFNKAVKEQRDVERAKSNQALKARINISRGKRNIPQISNPTATHKSMGLASGSNRPSQIVDTGRYPKNEAPIIDPNSVPKEISFGMGAGHDQGPAGQEPLLPTSPVPVSQVNEITFGK